MVTKKQHYESPWLTFRQFSGDCEIVRTSGGGSGAKALQWGEWGGGDWDENRDNTYIQEKTF